MGYMILEYEFSDGSYGEICGKSIKYWEGEGLPDFEGDLADFAEVYPNHIVELLAKKIVKIIK